MGTTARLLQGRGLTTQRCRSSAGPCHPGGAPPVPRGPSDAPALAAGHWRQVSSWVMGVGSRSRPLEAAGMGGEKHPLTLRSRAMRLPPEWLPVPPLRTPNPRSRNPSFHSFHAQDLADGVQQRRGACLVAGRTRPGAGHGGVRGRVARRARFPAAPSRGAGGGVLRPDRTQSLGRWARAPKLLQARPRVWMAAAGLGGLR